MRTATWLVMGGAVLLAACQDVTEPGARPGMQAASLPEQAQGVGDEQSALARAVPGFGGFFFDEGGRPTAYLTDAAQAPALRARIGMLSAMRGRSGSELVIRRGNFPYAQLEAAFARATPAAFELEGTVFSDFDEARNLVVVGVERPGQVSGARAALARAGLAHGEYDVIVSEPVSQMATLQSEFNPTVGGIQIHFTKWLCTLGANVLDGTERSFVTNSHCTAKQGGVEGTQYYQPTSSVNSQVIATEVEDPVYSRLAGCPKGKVCRYSDASRAAYSASQGSTGDIAITAAANSGSLTVVGYYRLGSEGTGQLAAGATVNKVGRTTGWTQAPVSRTCTATGVSGTRIVQLCQYWVTSPSAQIVGGGDSGSSVWTGSGNNATLQGLLWGGSSDNRTFIYSPWSGVQSELGDLTLQ